MSANENTPYTSFWAVAWFLLIFSILTATDLYGMFQYRAAVQKALVQAQQPLGQARAVNTALNGLTRDLILLSDRSAGARQIVQEFGIRAVKGPGANQAPAKK